MEREDTDQEKISETHISNKGPISNNNKYLQGCGETGTLMHSW